VSAIDTVRPDVVVNCIGLIKQLDISKDWSESVEINSLFPRKLETLCAARDIRLVHFSTDCVFSGTRGMYRQTDVPDATDVYGKTKFLGEVCGSRSITVRSSIIGRELGTKNGLLEWFLSNRGKSVKGYRKAIYSGFTTIEMGRIVNAIITNHKNLSGVWQVASNPISKYDLLRLINERFELVAQIEPDDGFVCDRSLDGTDFSKATGYAAPSWERMVEELAKDVEQ
jgi:dTDP-4-dehydrorhamnose reductase